jgi:hypothetical protein
MTFPSLTVQEFKTQLTTAVMDDLVESMQMLNKLVTLRSKMTLADRSFAITLLAGIVVLFAGFLVASNATHSTTSVRSAAPSR